jgi:hypothetical protein
MRREAGIADFFQNRQCMGVLETFFRVFRSFSSSFGLYFRFKNHGRQHGQPTNPSNEVSSHVPSRRSKTPPSPLTKAVAEFLPAEGVPFSKALEVTKAVVQAFGSRGGQRVPYDRELCAKLRLAKSLSPDEERRWQQFGRLPDHVSIQNPQPSPHWQHDADARTRVGHLLAQVSPLYLASLRLR